jgi:hypothetical protein
MWFTELRLKGNPSKDNQVKFMLKNSSIRTLFSDRRTIKFIHLAGTAWLVLNVCYIVVLVLRQVGFRWWVIFSLSGHSALIIFLLISIYLFAVFRGAAKTQAVEIEHPLTSTNYYLMFYAATPILAGVMSSLTIMDEQRISLFASGIAMGTLGMTFIFWVVVDPVIASLELLLPRSRRSRTERLIRAKTEREEKRKDSQLLLARILKREEQEIQRWQRDLVPQAEKLAMLLAAGETDFKQAELEAIEIGARAWQIGGLSCMQQLRQMAISKCMKGRSRDCIDYVSVWWEGIGTWRNPSIC